MRNKWLIILLVIILAIINYLKNNSTIFILAFFELLILTWIILEDESNMEITLNKFVLLLLLTVIKIFFSSYDLSIKVLLFSNILFLAIYSISKKNIGEGDILLNGILALNFSSLLLYYYFFTLTFLIGAIDSIIILARKTNNRRIPFTKYMVASYYIISILGG